MRETGRDDLATDDNENWADYIDRLRGFEPPTLRLKRMQRILEARRSEGDLSTHRERQHLKVVERPEPD